MSVPVPEVRSMSEEPVLTPEELCEEFIEMVADTKRRLIEVLAQSPVRGGVLGTTRLKAREAKLQGKTAESASVSVKR